MKSFIICSSIIRIFLFISIRHFRVHFIELFFHLICYSKVLIYISHQLIFRSIVSIRSYLYCVRSIKCLLLRWLSKLLCIQMLDLLYIASFLNRHLGRLLDRLKQILFLLYFFLNFLWFNAHTTSFTRGLARIGLSLLGKS